MGIRNVLHVFDSTQLVTVGDINSDCSTIQAAIDSISDAASDKIYTVLIAPGEYDEVITLSDYVNIIAIDPANTFIQRGIIDNGATCNCTIEIGINCPSTYNGLDISAAGSNIILKGNITMGSIKKALRIREGNVEFIGNISMAGASDIIWVSAGTLRFRGRTTTAVSAGITQTGGTLIIEHSDITVGVDIGTESGTLIIRDSYIKNLYSSATDPIRNGIFLYGGTVVLKNVTIVCTEANATSIYAASAQNAKIYSIYANKAKHGNITNIITGGLEVVDADVE